MEGAGSVGQISEGRYLPKRNFDQFRARTFRYTPTIFLGVAETVVGHIYVQLQ
jgi:hypothetical protein